MAQYKIIQNSIFKPRTSANLDFQAIVAIVFESFNS